MPSTKLAARVGFRWQMGQRSFSREFKLEAVRLVRERGVSVAQAARDLDLHQNSLRNGPRSSGCAAKLRS
jgi:transposase-like protein